MKEARKKRNIAIIVMCGLILLGMIFGTRISLMKEKNKLNEMFATADLNGATISTRINTLIDESDKLCSEAVSVLKSSDAEYKNVVEAKEKLSKAKKPDKQYQAMNELASASIILAGKTKNAMTDTDSASYRQVVSSLGVIEGIRDRLVDFRADYNTAVRKFNNTRNAFPCRIFAILGFVGEAVPFD